MIYVGKITLQKGADLVYEASRDILQDSRVRDCCSSVAVPRTGSPRQSSLDQWPTGWETKC